MLKISAKKRSMKAFELSNVRGGSFLSKTTTMNIKHLPYELFFFFQYENPLSNS